MRFWGIVTVVVFTAAAIAGCTDQSSAKLESIEFEQVFGSGYSAAAISAEDEIRQKQRAQELTLGGRREDGMHYINYNSPSYMDIVIFAKRAQDYLRRNGSRKALEDFMNPDSQFVSGRMYIFAYSAQGECLADWADPARIGRVEDYRVFAALDGAAGDRGGWVTGKGLDPVTRQVRFKESYVLRCPDGMIIGAGIYRDTM